MQPNLVFLAGILGPDDNYNLTQISEESFFLNETRRSKLDSKLKGMNYPIHSSGYQLFKTAPLHNLPALTTTLTDLLIQYGARTPPFADLTFAPIVKGLYCQGYVYTFQEDSRTQPATWKLLMCVDLATENLTDRLKEDYLPQVDQLITYLTGIHVAQQRDEKLEILLSKIYTLNNTVFGVKKFN